MPEWLTTLFDSEAYMPHGHCFFFEPVILWLHIVSDAAIALSYYSLPLALIYFAKKRPDMPFRHMFVMFGAFIMLCGSTHLIAIWTLYHPDYGIEGIVKALTAIVSLATAVIAWKIMPQLLTLPSPSQLEAINAQLVATNREIEQRVQERTLAVEESNRKLESAYALAEKANQAKRDFLANMSHELRTPMNAIVGIANLMATTEATPERKKEFVHTLQLSAQSMLALVNDILDIAKIESDNVKLDNSLFDLRAIIQEVMTMMDVLARQKGLKLDLMYDDAMEHTFIGDPTRIRQILLNLVNNAVKFTDSGKVQVHVNLQRPANAGITYTTIEVSDTGIGIAPDRIEMIFDKFSQADNLITRKYGGTGLGLAITRSLVELMGGTIHVSSAPGKGSRFTISLPLARPSDMQRIPQHSSSGAPAQKEHTAGTAPHILLVEDYQPNVLVAAAHLEEFGYSYEVAYNGEEALQKMLEGRFSLVLMDIQMPLMDGYRATRLLREQEQKQSRTRTPILGLTAYAMTGDREKCINAGMDDYLAKPFQAEELHKKIKALLKAPRE